MTVINVIKRDGSKEPLNLEKIHKVISWACEGLEAYPSQIEMKSHLQFMDGIKSEDIHSIIVKAAADLISEKYPDYQYAAARLLMFNLRKKAFGEFTPPHLGTHIEIMTVLGKYDTHILEDYSLIEINSLDSFLRHERDLDFAYAGAKQLEGKYLLQDKVTGEIYESPQFLYMLVGMCLFSGESKDVRLKYVKEFYEAASTHKFSLPTPIMAGVRTTQKQFSSCTLIECGDSLDSINDTSSAVVKYISQKAGIGLNAGAIRAVGSPIRGGQAVTTGMIPFLKLFQASVKSCSQGSVRGGAATVFYPLWHYEVEELLVLKNNKGVEENRVRHLDYGVQFNKLMYKRLLEGGNITLFSPHDVEGLYEAFFADQEKFEQLYVEAEGNPSIRKKTIKAVELFSQFAIERAATGRIYLQNVDHCNEHSPFNPDYAPIKQSNLCVAPETKILTDKGYKVIEDLEGQDVTVWNGEEWSGTQVVKTSDSSELVTVKTLVGTELVTIDCTPYHKFYTNWFGEIREVRAIDLKRDDVLIRATGPESPNGFYPIVDEVVNKGRTDKTYCVHEPKRNKVIFNGILTGNCLEIALPTKPMASEEEEIALCTLAAFNLGEIDDLRELERLSEILVRALDNLLDYQDYPLKAAEVAAKARRSLGVGVINYAYYLAKNGVKYSDGSAKELTQDTFEALQYYLLKASNKLAQEKGKCDWYEDTNYHDGIIPCLDTFKAEGSLSETGFGITGNLWSTLWRDIHISGLRNSTLSALMPSETSSQVSNATNGIEPPRGFVSIKGSKEGSFKQVVPDYKNLKDSYELLWDIPDNKGYIELIGIMQRYVDQSISANTNYDPLKFPDGKVPVQVILQDILEAYKRGVKTLYYHNTRDGAGEADSEPDDGCEGGACKI